jgi:hypothetical protein
MNVNKMFPSRYATGADLNGKSHTLVIARIAEEEMRPQPTAAPVKKFVLYFKNAQKGIILSRTLTDQIAAVLGQETEEWTGKKITIYAVPLRVAGKDRLAIRAKAPIDGTTPVPPTLQEVDEEE